MLVEAHTIATEQGMIEGGARAEEAAEGGGRGKCAYTCECCTVDRAEQRSRLTFQHRHGSYF